MMSLSGAGLLLGGYLGGIAVPMATGALVGMFGGLFAPPGPRLLGGLLAAASVLGAFGEQLVLAGRSGPLVTGLANAIPQVMCLAVICGIIAALIKENRCAASSD
jgi:hypothetical protein